MTEIRRIIQSNLFARHKKKLDKKQIQDLDKTVLKLKDQPESGDLKKGDLSNIRVAKFKSGNTQFLLAYEIDGEHLYLYAVGIHENFYRDLEKYLND